MTIREGRWDCQYCGAKAILGRHQACPTCAKSRPEGTKFYMVDDETAVTDQQKIDRANLGADWVCEFCQTSNTADRENCSSCFAARGTSPSQQAKRYAAGEAPRSGDMDMDYVPPERQQPTQAPKAKRPAWLIPAGIGALLFLCLCLCLAVFAFGRPQQAEATVTQTLWERTVQVEAFETVVEEDWSVPSGGRTLSQREEIHHYDQVLSHYETGERQVSEQVQVGTNTYVCGQEDLGNGFFRDIQCTDPVYETQYRTESYQEPVYLSVPVYQTKYSYEIDKWIVKRTERADGDSYQPAWPTINLRAGEREGARQERYTVVFTTADGQTYSQEMSLAEWQTFERGMGVELTISGGRIEEINR
jgi:hypothetical protein